MVISTLNRVASTLTQKLSSGALPRWLAVTLSITIASTPLHAQDNANANSGVRPLLDLVLPPFDPAHADLGTLTPSDEAQIRNLITRVHFSIDTRHYDAAGEVFADDGVLDFQWGRGQGPKAIAGLFGKHRPDETGVRHHGLNELIVGNSDGTATVFGYLLVVSVADPKTGNPISPRIIGAGVETFRMKKAEGVWRIAEMLQEQTVLDASIAKPEDIRFTALTAEARAKERSKAR